MSGDCPHHKQAQDTTLLQQYQQQAALLAATKLDYLHIIGDLKNELETLSCQVTSILALKSNEAALPSAVDTSSSLIEAKGKGTAVDHTKTTITTTSPIAAITATSSSPTPSALPMDFDTDLMRTLHDLEHQNDLLQAALEKATINREDAYLELQENNAFLKTRLQRMCFALAEKDKVIDKQQAELTQATTPSTTLGADALNNASTLLTEANKRIDNLESDLDRSRNAEQMAMRDIRRLNDELIDSSRRNGELKTQVERLRLMLHDNNENFEAIHQRYDTLQKNSEDQSKQIHELHQRIAALQQNSVHCDMESKILQNQLSTLKEKDAINAGELKSLHDRYTKLEKELMHANQTNVELKKIVHHENETYETSLQRLRDVNNELEKRLFQQNAHLEKLQKEHDQLHIICAQHAKTIETYRGWKGEQEKSEADTKDSIQGYRDHIELLTEQNISCLERCRILHQDNNNLAAEIKRLRVATLSPSFLASAPLYDNGLVNRLGRLRETTQRVLQQKVHLNSGDTAVTTRPTTPNVPIEMSSEPKQEQRSPQRRRNTLST